MSDGQRGWAWGRKLILKEGGSSRRNSGARVLTETSNRSRVPVSLTHSLTRGLLHRKAESIKSAFLLEPFLSLHTLSPWMAISFVLFLGGWGRWAATTDFPRRGSGLHFLARLRATSCSQAFLSVRGERKEPWLGRWGHWMTHKRNPKHRDGTTATVSSFHPRPVDKRSICILSSKARRRLKTGNNKSK